MRSKLYILLTVVILSLSFTLYKCNNVPNIDKGDSTTQEQTQKEIKIIFKTESDKQEILVNKDKHLLTQPIVKKKDGFLFKGWKNEKTNEVFINLPEQFFESATFIAVYEAIPEDENIYTIQFEMDTKVIQIETNKDKTLSKELELYVPEGKILSGWKLKGEESNILTQLPAKFYKNSTYIAVYELKSTDEDVYTIQFEMDKKIVQIETNKDKTLSKELEIYIPEGKILVGWKLKDSDNSILNELPKKFETNATYIAVYEDKPIEEITYTIEFEMDSKIVQIETNKDKTLSQELKVYVPEGKIHVGWKLKGEGNPIISKLPEKFDGNFTYIAVYEDKPVDENIYTIVFEMDRVSAQIDTKKDKTLSKELKVYIPQGKILAGWKLKGKGNSILAELPTKFYKNSTYVAIYENDDIVTIQPIIVITFDFDGEIEYIPVGKDGFLYNNPKFKNLENKNFIGWYSPKFGSLINDTSIKFNSSYEFKAIFTEEKDTRPSESSKKIVLKFGDVKKVFYTNDRNRLDETPTIPDFYGFKFKGWKSIENNVEGDFIENLPEIFEKDMVYNAIYTKTYDDIIAANVDNSVILTDKDNKIETPDVSNLPEDIMFVCWYDLDEDRAVYDFPDYLYANKNYKMIIKVK